MMATAASAKYLSVPFSDLDSSGDQRVSLEELHAVFGAQAVWLMAQRDAGGDGNLVEDELKAHRLRTATQFVAADRDSTAHRQVSTVPVAVVAPETAPTPPPLEVFDSHYILPVEAPVDDNFIQMPEPIGLPWNNGPRGGATEPSEDTFDFPATDNGW